jgi:hypothetical protein
MKELCISIMLFCNLITVFMAVRHFDKRLDAIERDLFIKK